MLPFLLLIVLIMYGEFSKDRDTRYLSRILFYAYTTANIIPQYIPEYQQGVLAYAFLMGSGIFYCICRCHLVRNAIPFIIALTCLGLNTVTLYTQDFMLLEYAFYAENSHFIFRDSLMAGVAMFAITEDGSEKNWELSGMAFLLWMMETIWFR